MPRHECTVTKGCCINIGTKTLVADLTKFCYWSPEIMIFFAPIQINNVLELWCDISVVVPLQLDIVC